MQACIFGERFMACRTVFIIAIMAALLAAPAVHAQGAAEPTGVWLTQAGASANAAAESAASSSDLETRSIKRPASPRSMTRIRIRR